ncbi:hypothetical protein P7L74_04720 (plasmid) [Tistrella mobilis]|uniref:RAMP superfamily CRISPR-associated protein n=1 Tax=Tistrella mobilis TaxID=171437 RepID=UPI003559011A
MSVAFRPSDVITARFELSAPMFSGQEGDKGPAEIRPTEIKAALRFWWRALAWGRGVRTPQALKEQEDILFGTAAGEGRNGAGGRGQGAFLLRVRMKHNAGKIQSPPEPGLKYVGYGLWNKNEWARPSLKEGSVFSVEILPRWITCKTGRRPLMDEDQQSQITDALKLFGLVGGVGGRVRRGFGSVTLTALTHKGEACFTRPKNLEEYRQILKKLVTDNAARGPESTGDVPQWTAFWPGYEDRRGTVCTIVHFDEAWLDKIGDDAARLTLANDPLVLLDFVGGAFQQYRSWGRNGNIAYKGLRSWRQFQADHDVSKGEKAELPVRSIFGLPHPYRKAFRVVPVLEKKGKDRRASPLFIHIHKINRKYICIINIFTGQFLEESEKIKIESDVHSKEEKLAFDQNDLDFDVILGLLGMSDSRRYRTPFEVSKGGLIFDGKTDR